MRPLSFVRCLAPVLAFLLLAGGCRTPENARAEWGVPEHVVRNVYAPGPLPAEVQRVVLLPVAYTASIDGPFLQQLDSALLGELQRQQRFEVVPVRREELESWTGRRQIPSTGIVHEALFEAVRAETGADAVLLVDLVHYRPYKPLALGLRARLVPVKPPHDSLWACDELFDSGSAPVAVSAQRFQRAFGGQPEPLDTTGSVLQSPARFARYAAWEVFSTLPPR